MEPMIRNIIVPRVLGKTPDEVQPALELFRALGATPGRDCEGGGAYGFQLEAPRGTVEFLAAPQPPASDLAVEVSDADAAWDIARNRGVKVVREIGDSINGDRFFMIEVSGLKVTVVKYATPDGHGIEGSLQAEGKRFAIVVARFNSFITERLLDGALLALRQSGAARND